MVFRLRNLVFLGVFVILSWIGFNAYFYLFSTSAPSLKISGIEVGGHYQGDTRCIITGKDDYKVSNISISLDGIALVPDFKIGKKEFEYPFTIPTQTLNNGKHTLLVEIQNGTYNKVKSSEELDFFVDNLPLQAAFVKGDVDAKVFQGRTLHVQFQVNKEIKEARAKVLSKDHLCFAESLNSLIYDCYIPIECEQVPNEYLLNIEITDKVGNKTNLESKYQVIMYPFKKQNIKIDQEKIKIENETGISEKEFEAKMEELTSQSPKQKLWQGVFIAPLEIREQRQITTDFGVIRTTQERGLRQHKALDIYNTPRSVIWAPQDGIVVLKNRYAHAGNTVVIDHGFGVLSLFFHLDSFANIEVGEKIKKGNPVGALGKTGYATGYHLHWEMRINNIAVDPMQWTKHDF